MESTQRVTVGGALLLGVIVGILLLGLAPGVAAQADNETAPANASFGAQVSAYMQSTAADANGSVDRGMWGSAAANASNPGAVVSERARALERRVARLENESETLATAASTEGAAGVVYTARASAVRAELANLRQSLDQTAATAASTGVDDERLTAARSCSVTRRSSRSVPVFSPPEDGKRDTADRTHSGTERPQKRESRTAEDERRNEHRNRGYGGSHTAAF